MTAEQKTIGLFYRHSEAFIKMISRFYAFTPDQITNYADILDFKLLSANSNCIWNEEIVNRFQDKIDWVFFSAKSKFFSDPVQIARYNSKIIWGTETHQKENQSYLSYAPHESIAFNFQVSWSAKLIDKYSHLLNLKYLSLNKTVKWNYELIDKYLGLLTGLSATKNISILNKYFHLHRTGTNCLST